jgi:hypothetical protein
MSLHPAPKHELTADDLNWSLGPRLDVAPDDRAFEFCDGYKAIAIEALDALARATKRHRQQREEIARLVDELKRLREFLLEQDRAA